MSATVAVSFPTAGSTPLVRSRAVVVSPPTDRVETSLPNRSGGTAEGNRAAQLDARDRFLSFFERHLGAGRRTEARPLLHGLEPGPHAVGWRVVTAVDETRPFACGPDADGPGRPVRLFVWYPATHSDAPVLRHGDSFEVDIGPEPFSAALP